MDNDKKLVEEENKNQSTRPENWPGIPSRSSDSEVDKNAPRVTQAQRELERKSE